MALVTEDRCLMRTVTQYSEFTRSRAARRPPQSHIENILCPYSHNNMIINSWCEVKQKCTETETYRPVNLRSCRRANLSTIRILRRD